MLLQPQLQRPFTVLQSLVVRLSSDEPRDMPAVIAPALREICLRGNFTLPSTAECTAEYPLLTTLKFSDYTARAVRTTLNRFPHLLHIMAQTRPDNYLAVPATVPPPALLRESLFSAPEADDGTWPPSLGAFTLPRLRHLALPRHSAPAVLLECIARSCDLEILQFAIVPWKIPASLVDCLRAVPSLINLEIRVGDFSRLDASHEVQLREPIVVLEARASTLTSFHLALDEDPLEGGSVSRAQFDRICVNGFKITWDREPRIPDEDSATFALLFHCSRRDARNLDLDLFTFNLFVYVHTSWWEIDNTVHSCKNRQCSK
ncbi:hypothetical protein C8R44DRAFT_874406 [Mycena epipterygia]|nr:hypothetical protein C8R44DRAFT_874406 [Mycena epipterygia]